MDTDKLAASIKSAGFTIAFAIFMGFQIHACYIVTAH
jgi:hypothetical protein